MKVLLIFLESANPHKGERVEKPILFSTDMVRAIIDGRKTVTRRVIKPKTLGDITGGKPAKRGGYSFLQLPDGGEVSLSCPYQADRLWVRETWNYGFGDGVWKECEEWDGKIHKERPEKAWISYKEDYSDIDVNEWKWRPSIFMPRWACRIVLNVVDIRVERLQDITEEDSVKEGVCGAETEFDQATPIMCFASLWDSLNKNRGYGWDKNPLVWRVEFKIAELPDNQ